MQHFFPLSEKRRQYFTFCRKSKNFTSYTSYLLDISTTSYHYILLACTIFIYFSPLFTHLIIVCIFISAVFIFLLTRHLIPLMNRFLSFCRVSYGTIPSYRFIFSRSIRKFRSNLLFLQKFTMNSISTQCDITDLQPDTLSVDREKQVNTFYLIYVLIQIFSICLVLTSILSCNQIC